MRSARWFKKMRKWVNFIDYDMYCRSFVDIGKNRIYTVLQCVILGYTVYNILKIYIFHETKISCDISVLIYKCFVNLYCDILTKSPNFVRRSKCVRNHRQFNV